MPARRVEQCRAAEREKPPLRGCAGADKKQTFHGPRPAKSPPQGEDAAAAGISLACNSVICNDAPDDEATEACKALGAALA